MSRTCALGETKAAAAARVAGHVARTHVRLASGSALVLIVPSGDPAASTAESGIDPSTDWVRSTPLSGLDSIGVPLIVDDSIGEDSIGRPVSVLDSIGAA